MPSRLERHGGKTQTVHKRVSKNQNLYEELKKYKNYVEVQNIEAVIEREDFDLNEVTESKRRVQKTPKELIPSDKLSNILRMDDDKEHDINKILREAKETRREPDELEEKRRLKKEEYNITNKVDMQKLEEIKEKRKQNDLKTQQEELKELIDTIYSKGLKEEIAKRKFEQESEDLFLDLLPSSEDETLVGGLDSKSILEKEKERKVQQVEKQKETMKKIESSFFTKSTELSPKDLEAEDEDEALFIEENHLPVWAIILITVGILAVVGIAGFWIYNSVL